MSELRTLSIIGVEAALLAPSLPPLLVFVGKYFNISATKRAGSDLTASQTHQTSYQVIYEFVSVN